MIGRALVNTFRISRSVGKARREIYRSSVTRGQRRVAFIAESLEPRRFMSLTPLNSDDAIPFQQIVLDPNPGTTPVVKLLADLTNSGHQDAVVGHESSLGGGGLDWYQFPASGNPNDPWIEHTIDPNADTYEAAVATNLSGNVDSHGNPVNDLIVCERGTIYWYENPLGHGEDPATATWTRHLIGSISQGATHELYLADVDGDGKLDVVTNDAIFCQNSPDNWTRVANPTFNRTEKGAYLFNSGSGLGSVDLVGTGNGPDYQVGWYENPRDHRGDARTDTWNFHPVGPAYGDYSGGDGVSYAAMDVNGDGRGDIITSDGENGQNPPYLSGGLTWWEAPADRANGTWIQHTIDTSVTDVHNLVLADMNGDGTPEILAFEQDQSPQGRLMIIYNEGGTGQNWLEQTLSSDATVAGGFGGAHNASVGDATGDGNLDILTSPHGYYSHVNPISLWLNNLSADGVNRPKVTTAPVSQSVRPGKPVTLVVAATGSGPLTYQWQKNGLDIPGANGSSYTTPAVHTQDDGEIFRCIIGNPAGLIPSAGATLYTDTKVASVLTSAHASLSTVTGISAQLNVLGDGPQGESALKYTWTTLHKPSGAVDPHFAVNGTLSALADAVTFSKDGTYIFRCTIRAGKGDSVTTDAAVVVQQTPTTLRVTPHHRSILRNGTLEFHTVTMDQFGHAMRASSAIQYSVASGLGSIDSNSGVFTAANQTGAALIEVDGDLLKATVKVKVA